MAPARVLVIPNSVRARYGPHVLMNLMFSSEILIVKAHCDDVLLVPVFIIESDNEVSSNDIYTATPLPTK